MRISWADIGDRLSAAVFAGLVAGKPMGVATLSWLAVRLGAAKRPHGSSWSLIAAGSLMTGMGFTMSLFIAELAFDPATLGAAEIGILGAFIAAGTAGLLVLTGSTSARRAGRAAEACP